MLSSARCICREMVQTRIPYRIICMELSPGIAVLFLGDQFELDCHWIIVLDILQTNLLLKVLYNRTVE